MTTSKGSKEEEEDRTLELPFIVEQNDHLGQRETQSVPLEWQQHVLPWEDRFFDQRTLPGHLVAVFDRNDQALAVARSAGPFFAFIFCGLYMTISVALLYEMDIGGQEVAVLFWASLFLAYMVSPQTQTHLAVTTEGIIKERVWPWGSWVS